MEMLSIFSAEIFNYIHQPEYSPDSIDLIYILLYNSVTYIFEVFTNADS